MEIITHKTGKTDFSILPKQYGMEIKGFSVVF